MYLIDTNIFLEIMLGQKKAQECKEFLVNNLGKLQMSDFSLHSIGVILDRYRKITEYPKFIGEVKANISVLTLPLENYAHLVKSMIELGFDFDDGYQYSLAKLYNLKIVSMDRDFSRVEDIEVINFGSEQ